MPAPSMTIDHYPRRGATVPMMTTKQRLIPCNLSGRRKRGERSPRRGEACHQKVASSSSCIQTAMRKPRGLSANEGESRRARLFLHQLLVRERESGVDDPQVPDNPSAHPLPPSHPPCSPPQWDPTMTPLQGKRGGEQPGRGGGAPE